MKKRTPHSARCSAACILSSYWIHRAESWAVQERGGGGGGGCIIYCMVHSIGRQAISVATVYAVYPFDSSKKLLSV